MYSTFSVLLSVYIKERSEYLERSLQSIWDDQILKPTEIIIVKDGPLTSELQTVLSDFATKAPVKFVVNQANMGLAYALNRGLEVCRCDLIARMDTDDISLQERFERQVAFMDANKKVDICGTWAIEINENGKEFFKKQMPITHKECFKFEEKRDCMIHPSVMFRRSFFEKAGVYDEICRKDQDTMLWGMGFKTGCVFANLSEYLLKFRVSESTLQRRGGWKRAKQILKLRFKINKMLGFGFKAHIYACLYAGLMLMPKPIMKLIYKKAR
jgi:glycosyltransferase involved in cell wall biosynthesis